MCMCNHFHEIKIFFSFSKYSILLIGDFISADHRSTLYLCTFLMSVPEAWKFIENPQISQRRKKKTYDKHFYGTTQPKHSCIHCMETIMYFFTVVKWSHNILCTSKSNDIALITCFREFLTSAVFDEYPLISLYKLNSRNF